MAGGVRVLQPADQGPLVTPDIDTVQVYVAGQLRQRERVEVANHQGLVARGERLSALPGLAVTVCTVIAPQGYYLRGFHGTGSGDGLFQLSVADTLVLADRIYSQRRSCTVALPVGLFLAAGTTVSLAVTNQTDGLRDYEGSVFGEVEVVDG